MVIYKVSKITDSLYSIKEDITDNQFPILIYLVVGAEKAALIDTGLGTDDLRKIVESITRLPIVVLHTHAHGDHIGADALFDEVYLNSREYNLSGNGYDFNATTQQRLKFIKPQLSDNPDLYEYIEKHIVKSKKINYKNIDDGDIINLGGIRLEAISTPGHTQGSLSYVNLKEHYAFTGDGIADIHWFDSDDSIGVESFLDTLNHFEERVKDAIYFYAAHIPDAFGINLIHDLKTSAQAIINGADDKIENSDYYFLKHGDLYANRSGAATIYYDKKYIYHKNVKPGIFTLKF